MSYKRHAPVVDPGPPRRFEYQGCLQRAILQLEVENEMPEQTWDPTQLWQ